MVGSQKSVQWVRRQVSRSLLHHSPNSALHQAECAALWWSGLHDSAASFTKIKTQQIFTLSAQDYFLLEKRKEEKHWQEEKARTKWPNLTQKGKGKSGGHLFSSTVQGPSSPAPLLALWTSQAQHLQDPFCSNGGPKLCSAGPRQLFSDVSCFHCFV